MASCLYQDFMAWTRQCIVFNSASVYTWMLRCNHLLEPRRMYLCACTQVYLKAPMILNGVCVIWRGWIDLQRLDGMGCLEYDDERAQV